MGKNKRGKYPVGYKQPPRENQFKPGQSGNPKGRPKKGTGLADILANEIQVRVPIVTNGKRKIVSVLRAIVKQNLNKAANGDIKAAALVFNQLKETKPEQGNYLSDLVHEFRALHSRHLSKENDPTEKKNRADPGLSETGSEPRSKS